MMLYVLLVLSLGAASPAKPTPATAATAPPARTREIVVAVSAVVENELLLNVGTEAGLVVGMTGTVFQEREIGGRKARVRTAFVRIVRAERNTSRAVVVQREAEIGAVASVSFNVEVRAASSAPTPTRGVAVVPPSTPRDVPTPTPTPLPAVRAAQLEAEGRWDEALAVYASIPESARSADLATKIARAEDGVFLAKCSSTADRGDWVAARDLLLSVPEERLRRLASERPVARAIDVTFAGRMARIEAGEFQMGSPLGDEAPLHAVRTRAYLILRTEVTFLDWTLYRRLSSGAPEPGVTEERHRGDDKPVVGVSWEDAAGFCRWLASVTGAAYRLPTEAEWERAARGGKAGAKFSWGNEQPKASLAVFRRGFQGTADSVGLTQPNELGIHDTAGNVWEWCADWYSSTAYASAPHDDPTGPTGGKERVVRGGCWNSPADDLRVSNRNSWDPNRREAFLGFRIVRDP